MAADDIRPPSIAGVLEDLTALRDEVDSAIGRGDHGNAFALGLLYIGDCILAAEEMRQPARVEIRNAAPQRGDAGGLDTLFDAFARSPAGRQAQQALGLAPYEPRPQAWDALARPLTVDEREAARDRIRNAGKPAEPTMEDELRDEPAEALEQRAEEAMARDPYEDEPAPDRHPQIPAQAWDALNLEQKRQVDDLVERILRSSRAAIEATTPTDRETYSALEGRLVAELTDDWGITLLAESEVDAEEREGLGDANAVPAPVTAGRPTTVEHLRSRARFLRSRTGLPPEAAQGRDEELAIIAAQLKARGDA